MTTALDGLTKAAAAFVERPIQRRLLAAAGTVTPDTVGDADLATLHTVLCQTSLPAARPPISARTWDRRNGDVTLRIEAGSGYDADAGAFVPLPLPYGAKARLALITLTSEAVRNDSADVDVGRSMTAFLAALLDRAPAGPDMRHFRQQFAAVIVATWRLGWKHHDIPVQVSTQIADVIEGMNPAAWADMAGHRGRWPWPRRIRLAAPFFGALKGHAVPLDCRALGALAHSALGLDVYSWLAQRLHRIDPSRPDFVPWPNLHEQFGGFGRLRDFRQHFLGVLATVMAVYRAARVTEETSARGQSLGLRLWHSPPPVLKHLVAVDKPGDGA